MVESDGAEDGSRERATRIRELFEYADSNQLMGKIGEVICREGTDSIALPLEHNDEEDAESLDPTW